MDWLEKYAKWILAAITILTFGGFVYFLTTGQDTAALILAMCTFVNAHNLGRWWSQN